MIRGILALVLVLASPALAQDATLAPAFDPSTVDFQAGMKRFQESMEPTTQHELLAALVGTWNTTTKLWTMGPGGDAQTSTGTATMTMDLGGRFLVSRAEGTMMGMPTTGLITIGYDAFAKKYQMVSTSTLSTSMHLADGFATQDGKAIVFHGVMDEMLLDVRGRTVRYVFTLKDADTLVMEVFDFHIGQENNKVVETTFERAS